MKMSQASGIYAERLNASQIQGISTTPKRKITCDQVAWLGDVLDRHRHASQMHDLGLSRAPSAAKLAAMLEIMEILHLDFADDAARGNAIACFPELRGLSRGTAPV